MLRGLSRQRLYLCLFFVRCTLSPSLLQSCAVWHIPHYSRTPYDTPKHTTKELLVPVGKSWRAACLPAVPTVRGITRHRQSRQGLGHVLAKQPISHVSNESWHSPLRGGAVRVSRVAWRDALEHGRVVAAGVV